MKQILFSNEADSTLLAGITAIATSCSVQAGDGAEFQQPTASQQFYGKFYNAAGDFEIVYVTARTTDTFTIERGKEGTSAAAWNAGDGFCCVATAEGLGQMVQRSQIIATAFNYAVATGSANAYAVTLAEVPLLLTGGTQIWFKANHDSYSETVTLNPNGLGNIPIVDMNGSVCPLGAIRNNAVVGVMYDGVSKFFLLTPTGDPVGSLLYVPATSPPSGYLHANGTLISRSTYPALFAYAAASGNYVAEGSWNKGKFSSGDLSTTFRIPDLRGYFIRGWSNGSAVDSGRTIGSYQADDNKAHIHGIRSRQWFGVSPLTGERLFSVSNSTFEGYYSESSGGTEARPQNVAMLACIKY